MVVMTCVIALQAILFQVGGIVAMEANIFHGDRDRCDWRMAGSTTDRSQWGMDDEPVAYRAGQRHYWLAFDNVGRSANLCAACPF